MSIFARNLASLQYRYPGVAWEEFWQNYSILDIQPTLSMTTSKNGSPNLLVHQQAVHSLYQPEQEATKLVAAFTHDYDAFALVGFGLGYTITALRQRFAKTPIFLIEPRLDFCAFILHHHDISAYIADPYTHIFWGSSPNQIAQLCEQNKVMHVHTLHNRTLSQYYGDYGNNIEQQLYHYKLRKQVNYATLHKQGPLWLRHFCHNMSMLSTMPGINQLPSWLHHRAILLVSAGPSLNTLWPMLDELRQRFLIVCVDTAARLFLAHGYEPDIIVAVDSQYWNARHLDFCYFQHSILIADPCLYPSLLRKNIAKKTFLISPLFPFGQYIESAIDLKGNLSSGGSVATTAYALCCHLQPSSLWCIGLDLAFPKGHTHARGALFEEQAWQQGYRLKPGQNFLAAQSHTAHPVWVDGNQGSPVLSDKRMEVYRIWFDEHTSGVSSYNLSQGVRIQNMPARCYDDTLCLPLCRVNLDECWANLDTISLNTALLQQKLADILHKVIQHTHLIIQLCHQALLLLDNDIPEQPAILDIWQQLGRIESYASLAFFIEPLLFHYQQPLHQPWYHDARQQFIALKDIASQFLAYLPS